MLILEFDRGKRWESSEIQIFTKIAISNSPPEEAFIIELIQGLGRCLEHEGVGKEIKQSILCALTKTNRTAVIPIFLKLLNESSAFVELCENTDILQSLSWAARREGSTLRSSKAFVSVVNQLEKIQLTDIGCEHARKTLVELMGKSA